MMPQQTSSIGEIIDIKTDIGELKTNVGFIKEEMHDMKQSLSVSVEKISNSMTVLATVTEKINNHANEHKNLTEKIEKISDRQDEQDEELEKHKDQLIEIQKTLLLFEEHRKREDEKIKNSLFVKVKDRILEYLFLILIALSVFVLAKHFNDFMSYMNNQSVIQLPTQIDKK